MSNPRLLFSGSRQVRGPRGAQPLGQELLAEALITERDLRRALGRQRRMDAQLGELLVAEGRVGETDILGALARQHAAQRIDLEWDPPKPARAGDLPAAFCLRHMVVPWQRIGELLLVATSRPDRFDEVKRDFGPDGPVLLPVIAPRRQIQRQVNRLYGEDLVGMAVQRTPARLSCRDWGRDRRSARRTILAAAILCGMLAAALAAPAWTFTAVLLWSLAALVLTTGLKTAALAAQVAARRGGAPIVLRDADATDRAVALRLPRVSVIVPLLREEDIAGALVRRLSRLTYPKALLNVVLVLEAKDTITRATLDRTELPDWMTVIEVPDDGTITTKPRALNYALDFCEGSIIGVWDAEDAPAPDQIETIVQHFHSAPADVVCLQGILDYYNARQNWLARCFTIEYATWFRLVLPGMARLGLVIPLGGTTLFFRRDALEELGRWDAHNVTEDADLGVRLARAGYRTQLVPTVTHEEANCRPWRWVRQRSRWLKGFMVTYLVHMRHPRRLLRDLGWKRVLGLQAIFLATVTQFAALPLLWTFWLPVAGIAHPLEMTLGSAALWAVGGLFLYSEAIGMILGAIATSGRAHRHLMPFVLTMPLYFPLATLAACKALKELIRSPFFWDKTAHGHSQRPDGQGG